MKPVYTFFMALISTTSAMAQWEMGGSYSLSLPQQEMASNIQPLHSLNATVLYKLPGQFKRVAIGTELGIGLYAYVSKDQDLRFPDGSGINTRFIYTSNVSQVNLFSRVYLHEEAKFNPYINGKAGYANFFSNVTVEDPDDISSCAPLDRKNIIRDHTFYYAWGGGFQIDLALFSKKQKPGKVFIDLAINQVSGGDLDYINTKHIQDHIHVDPNNPAPQEPGKGEPLNIRFVNISTQVVHEHQVAEIHRSAMRMLDLKFGVIARLD